MRDMRDTRDMSDMRAMRDMRDTRDIPRFHVVYNHSESFSIRTAELPWKQL